MSNNIRYAEIANEMTSNPEIPTQFMGTNLMVLEAKGDAVTLVNDFSVADVMFSTTVEINSKRNTISAKVTCNEAAKNPAAANWIRNVVQSLDTGSILNVFVDEFEKQGESLIIS